jgi:hypothetical protein
MPDRFPALPLLRTRPAYVLLVATGMLAGSLLATSSSGLSAAPRAVAQTRSVSCSTTAFRPTDSDTTYTVGSAHVLYRTSSSPSGEFRCDPGLPNEALVTSVTFTVVDWSDSAEVGPCQLFRFNLSPSAAADFMVMASVAGTGMGAEPGKVRLTDTSITGARINNTKHAYALSCSVPQDVNAGLFGASITFTISPANG